MCALRTYTPYGTRGESFMPPMQPAYRYLCDFHSYSYSYPYAWITINNNNLFLPEIMCRRWGLLEMGRKSFGAHTNRFFRIFRIFILCRVSHCCTCIHPFLERILHSAYGGSATHQMQLRRWLFSWFECAVLANAMRPHFIPVPFLM